jgi:hypothetical protein
MQDALHSHLRRLTAGCQARNREPTRMLRPPSVPVSEFFEEGEPVVRLIRVDIDADE